MLRLDAYHSERLYHSLNASISLATGDFSHDGDTTREVIAQWIDKPQQLWEAIDATLARGVEQSFTSVRNRT